MRGLRALLAVVLAVAAASCAQPARAASRARTEALRSSPLYPMLASYDRQIAALRATLGGPALTFGSARAADAAEADRDLTEGAQGRRSVAAGVANDRTTEARALADLARGGDAGGLPAYRTALAGTKTATLAGYARALDGRVSQAYDLRAAQFAQSESALAYALERRDAGETLPLRLKLELRPDAETRSALQRKLEAILDRETESVSTLAARDRSALGAYRSELEASARRDYAAASADASARTEANLRVRRSLALPSNGKLWDEWKELSADDIASIGASAEAFEAERTRNASRARNLSAIEAASRDGTLRQIAALQARRRALRDEILRELCRSRDSECRG